MKTLRLLHTSDWHLGRTIEGRSRHAEQVQVLNEVVEIAERNDVNIVLIAGDVFDTFNPSAEAQALYCSAIERLAGHGKRCVVVVAGNHDSPERLSAIRPLAERQGIYIFGRPRETLVWSELGQGPRIVHTGPGWFEVALEGVPHTAIISHLPYPSESRLGQMLSPELQEGKMRAAYTEVVAEILHIQATAFRADTVNIVISHLLALGGLSSDSERSIEIGGACAVDAGEFPSGAQYVALGHLHRPQQIKSTGQKTYYSGSPLSYSFSEANQTKVVYLVDVRPSAEAVVTSVPLTAGISLERWHCRQGMEEALRRLAELKGKTLWLELEVHVNNSLSQSELSSLYQLHNGLLSVRGVVPSSEDNAVTVALSELSIEEMFTRFYKHRRTGQSPKQELVEMFVRFANEVFVGERGEGSFR